MEEKRWKMVIAVLFLSLTVALPLEVRAQSRTINPTGGTNATDGLRILIGEQSQIQLYRDNTDSGEVYSPGAVPPNDSLFNGIFLAVGTTVFGPMSSVASGSIDEAWTPVSQSDVSGAGTAADPFVVETVVAAGSSGTTLTFLFSYVVPDEAFDVRITVTPDPANSEVIKVYHLIDTYLRGDDTGPALVEPGTGVPRIVGVERDSIIEAFVQSFTPWDHWYSALYSTAFEQIDDGADLEDTVDTTPTVDNGIGVQWTLGVITAPADIYYRVSFTNQTCTDDGDGVVDTNCRAGLPACEEMTNTCVECTDDDDCTSPDVCDLSTYSCQPCLDDEALGTTDTGCDDDMPNCLLVGMDRICLLCLDDSPAGSTDTGCSDDTPLCNADGDECVECFEDSDCAAGVCDPATNTCGTVEGCGDGAVAGSEECDDGNTTSGDGCSGGCEVETGFTCTGQPSDCVSTCGDGVRASDEECDDGNTDSGDGCSDECEEEASTCGNGVLDSVEECDDGNMAADDGCSDECEVEAGWTCSVSSPSLCCRDANGDRICDSCEESPNNFVPGFSGGATGCAAVGNRTGGSAGLLLLVVFGSFLALSRWGW